MNTFPCTQCGLCCQYVHLAEETRFLDRGDGVCGHYDAATKGCSIYDERPDICQVGKQYELNYRNRYTWDEFVSINLRVCQQLSEGDLADTP
ncbi:MAG: YkgJ family cysteine cluster protein [Gammaproteobacteria bacterium]|nr:YkgJ family cysteine cluster protein [Gammaproteobacteria bacterium]